MLLRLIYEGARIDRIIFFDTGWEFPEMLQHIKQVEEYINRPITILHPRRPFTYWAIERPIKRKSGPDRGQVYRHGCGWPSHMRRWCTREKVQQIDKHCGHIATRYIGYSADELHRTGKSTLEAKRYKREYPLIKWGMTEQDCLEYCYDRGFTWSGLYEKFRRVSCFCCPLQRIGELRKLRAYYPDLWGKMLKWDKAMGESNKGFRGYDTVQDLEKRFSKETLVLF